MIGGEAYGPTGGLHYSRRPMSRILVLPALLAVLLAAGCGDKQAPPKTTASTPAASTTETTAAPETDAAGCVKAEPPAPRGPGKLKRPTFKLAAGTKATVTLATNCGDIVIALDVTRAPRTASSVAWLAKQGFYDGLTFHRVLADFVIQGGDPLGNGRGGPGYNIVEKPPASLRYRRGVVAMAKSNVDPPGASGSQFFIVTAEDAGLPPEYALVGRVTRGMGAVNKIIAEPVDGAQGVPLSPVVIETATLSEG
jgi:cyclophilin family peptidyl-prolyl cis-trans isomerase